ncbi:response regulator [Glaciimonas immobilis]|uniref:DNA-binding response OmpR family regulator n=1 Tax=Glaciimonas immobilis TaxID=728004 RepID=A0A840RZ98_9BURK|nr:response regulator [Glaciimonas immobilis]KAF3996349.1 response regulator [Glaciimonas immobilis]MBB5202186.1 DNA-binding response OmpR family regulator [Glaciimonas immobilis]
MRLLLAEDDFLIGQGLQQGLRQEGFTVDWVQDGNAAGLALETTPYAALLLDLGLPRQDGMTLLKTLRQRDNPMAVIIITARDALADRLHGLDSGADDYLVKPFALEELVSRIRAVSRRQTKNVQPELAAGALRLDPIRHLVWLRDEVISVSPKEFALLYALMWEPDAVVSREQLEDRLYGWDEEISSNAVEVHIYNLRKKIGAEVIRTIRGVGYRIGDDA